MKKIVLLMMFIGSMLFANQIMKVTKIVDGDTVHLIDVDGIDHNIRFSYIDTMESVRNNRAKRLAAECKLNIEDIIKVGKEAKYYLSSLIPVGTIVEVNIVGLDSLGKREMGEIFLNGKSINEEMVISGHALPYLHYIKDREVYTRYGVDYVNSTSPNDPILGNECVKNFEK